MAAHPQTPSVTSDSKAATPITYDYVNADDAHTADLECAICQQPFVEPATNNECGHMFCHSCIQPVLQSNRCPTCRQPMPSVRVLSRPRDLVPIMLYSFARH
jgi:SUMO ligase MMS21 Smc5/6 complex component